MIAVQPGDVLAVRSPGLFPRLIRLAAALRGEPELDNHIAVAHHTDKAGTLWVLEGRPGGVGWRDARDYLRSPYTVANVAQPKTTAQRDTVCTGAVALIGTTTGRGSPPTRPGRSASQACGTPGG